MGVLKNILLVALGGAIGSALRYCVALIFREGLLPWSTLLVNVVGCFLIGFLSSLFETVPSSSNWKMLATVGFCGGFTTFSTYINENFKYLTNNEFLKSMLYLSSSVILGFAALYFGRIAARLIR